MDVAPDAAPIPAYNECASLVHAHDRDLWSASLFYPEPVRPHVLALYAFDCEIARVRDIVSEPMLGEIRHQWWREAIENRAPAGNPVAEALLDTIARFNLDAGRLLALIEARAFDLYDDPMASEAALDGYLRDTSVVIFESVARVLAAGRLPPACVAPAGRAFGLIQILRGLPYQVKRGQLFIPLDTLARYQLPPEHVLAHRNSPGLGIALNALRARVRNDLDAMRAGLAEAGPGKAACLPAFLCAPYLRAMERPGLDPFAMPIELAPWQRLWTLWRGARRL